MQSIASSNQQAVTPYTQISISSKRAYIRSITGTLPHYCSHISSDEQSINIITLITQNLVIVNDTCSHHNDDDDNNKNDCSNDTTYHAHDQCCIGCFVVVVCSRYGTDLFLVCHLCVVWYQSHAVKNELKRLAGDLKNPEYDRIYSNTRNGQCVHHRLTVVALCQDLELERKIQL